MVWGFLSLVETAMPRDYRIQVLILGKDKLEIKALKKQLIIIGIVVLLICVGLSGCEEQQSTEGNNIKAEQIEHAFLSNVRSI